MNYITLCFLVVPLQKSTYTQVTHKAHMGDQKRCATLYMIL